MRQRKNQKNKQLYLHKYEPASAGPFSGLPPTIGILVFLFSFFLSSQLGKHFFLPFSYLSGIRIDYLAPTMYLSDILFFILFVTTLYTSKKILQLKHIKLPLLLLISMGVLIVLNFVFAYSKEIWLYKSIKIVQWIGIVWLIRFWTQDKKMYFTILFGLFCGALFQLVLCVLQLSHRASLQGVWYLLGERQFSISTPAIAKAFVFGKEIVRPYGTFSHPNSLAGFYLLLYTYILTTRQSIHFVLKTTLLFVCSALILISFSKTGIVCFIGVNMFVFLWDKKRCKLCALSRILFSLFLIFITFNIVSDPLTLEKRYHLIAQSIQIFQKHPLWGVGLGNYLYAQQELPNPYPILFLQPVHNIVLLAITELGVFLFGVIVIGLLHIVHFKKKSYLLLLPFVVYITTGLLDHYWITLQQNILLSAVIFGIIQYEGKKTV